jgi:hypothetical protein
MSRVKHVLAALAFAAAFVAVPLHSSSPAPQAPHAVADAAPGAVGCGLCW